MNHKTAVDVETKQFRSAQIETKVLDEKEGIVQAIVGVTGNLDEGGDIIVPGFFKGAFAAVKPKGVDAHDWKMPVAKTLDAVEIEPGHKSLPGKVMDGGFGAARVTMQFNLDDDAKHARQTFSMVKFFGDEAEWSIGYTCPADGTRYADAAEPGELALIPARTKSLIAEKAKNASAPKARLLLKGTVWEYSPVLFGMNRLTATEGVKDLDADALEKMVERIVIRTKDAGAEPTVEQVTLVEGRTKDAEEAVSYLVADMGTKAGAVFAARNRARLAQIRDALSAMLGEAEPDDTGKAVARVLVAVKDGDPQEGGAYPATTRHAFTDTDQDLLCEICGLTREGHDTLMAELLGPKTLLGAPGVDMKIYAEMEGSWEDIQGEIRDAAQAMFMPTPETAADGSAMPMNCYVCVEATYPTRAVVSVCDYSSGMEREYYDVPWILDAANDRVVLGTPVEVDPQVTLVPVTDGATLSLVEGERKDGQTAHTFKPDSELPRRCADCGAGSSRPWHTSSDDDTGKAARAADAKGLEAEVLRWQAERALGRV